MERILVIADETDTFDLIEYNLSEVGYSVNRALSMDMLALVNAEAPPDLSVLDLDVSGVDGFRVFDTIKSNSLWRMIPVIMLSSHSQLEDRLEGLSRGADDYLGKPFSVRELALRVQGLLRRSAIVRSQLRNGPFLLDREGLRCYLRGKPLELTATEFKILSLLLEHPERTIERKQLVERVWDQQEENASRSLDTHMKRLRLKLGHHAKSIRTVRNKGYRFVSS